MLNQNRVAKGSNKGGEFAPDTSGKHNIPTASALPSKNSYASRLEVVEKLTTEFEALELLPDIGDKKADKKYNKVRDQLDDALRALLPEKIANLKVGDKIDAVFLNTKDYGGRAEMKTSGIDINEKVIGNMRKRYFESGEGTKEDPRIRFDLLDIGPAKESTIDPNEISLTTECEGGIKIREEYTANEK